MPHNSLTDALGVRPTDRLACVGAGGKTTLCWRVWNELCAIRQPAIFTTTTHILEPILPPDSALILAGDPDPTRIGQLLAHVTGVILAASRSSDAVDRLEPNPAAPARSMKLTGLSPEQIDILAAHLSGVTWLVEADGARGRGLKTPAAHEPAIPTRATAVAVLTHLDAIGRPLDDAIAHRPARVAEHLQMHIGDRVAAEHIVRLLLDPSAGLKGIPGGARAIAVLSQRDAAPIHPQAKSIAESLLAAGPYERVVAVSLRAEQPVLEVLAA